MYCYCYDNPIIYSDPSGHIAITSIIILSCIITGAVVGGTYAGVKAYNEGASKDEAILCALFGALIGGAIGGIIGYSAAPVVAHFFGMGGMALVSETGVLSLEITGTLIGLVTSTGAIAVTSVGTIGVLEGVMMFAKNSKQSGKATSSEKPSWVNESMIDPSKSPQQNATDILNDKYGPGNWHKGPKTEFNQIVKWIERHLKYYKGW